MKDYFLAKNSFVAEVPLNDLKAFIECSNTMDVYENIDDHHPTRRKILIIFDDMIADIFS